MKVPFLALAVLFSCGDAEAPRPDELCEFLGGSNVPFFGTAPLELAEGKLREVESRTGSEPEEVLARRRLADQLLHHGRVEEAIGHLEIALQLVSAHRLGVEAMVWRQLGVATLRSGERLHCIAMHNPERCLFPIRADGIWPDGLSALRAGDCFENALDLQPDDAGSRWLLNVAHMAAGSYPDGVRPEWRLPASVTDEDESVPRFRDIAGAVGVDTFGLCGGAVMDDVDGDGLLDLVASAWGACSPLRYYHNEGDGTFADWTERARLSEQYAGINLVQADYDGDELLDLLVLRGAWKGLVYGSVPNSLLRQAPDGTFEDVTREAGLGGAHPCLAAAWSDFDNDGDLDLYVGNQFGISGELFRNAGEGTFSDVAREAGVVNESRAAAVGWGDYDGDGDPDLYVSNLDGLNRLYRNDGDVKFTEVAEELGVAGDSGSLRTFPAWFFDFDNDGALDLFVASFNGRFSIGASPGDYSAVAADYMGLEVEGQRLRLFRNDTQGGFDDVTTEVDLDDVRTAMGANFGDIDNDGFLDIYLGTGAPPFDALMPNVLYRNVAGERFVDVTASARVGHLQKGHGVAFGDLDNDGDQDIYAEMGGAYVDDGFPDALFENPGTGNSWITIRAVGRKSNRGALGARIRLVIDEGDATREIHRVVGSGGSFGGSSLQQEIGLGRATRIRTLDVDWPASGIRQRFHDVPVDRFLSITEGVDEYESFRLPELRLAPPAEDAGR